MKKVSLFLVFSCVLLLTPTFAQRKVWKRDSLMKIINNTSLHDTTRARATERFSEYALYSDSLMKALVKADSACVKWDNYLLADRIMDDELYMLLHSGDSNKLKMFKLATDLLFYSQQHHDTLAEANAYMHRGQVYSNYDMLDKAVVEQIKASELYQHTKLKFEKDYSIYLVGYYMFNNHQYKEALPYFIRSYQLCIKDSVKSLLPEVSGWIGNTYSGLKIFDSALYYRYVNLRYSAGNPWNLSDGYRYLGNVYQSSGNYDSALIMYKKSLQYFNQIHWVDRSWLVKYFIAGVNFRMKNYAEAAKEVDEILDTATGKKPFLVTYLTTQLAGKAYDKAGEKDKSIAAYQNLVALNDSVQKSDKADNVTEMNAKMQFEQAQQMQLVEQQHKEELANKDKQRQAIIRNVLIVGFVGIMFFAVIVYRNFLQKKKANVQLAYQKQEIEEQKKEIVDSINYAKRLQDAILPPLPEIKKHLPESFVFYKPKAIVAGDFYWMQESEASTILIAACDCTGHGVPGAMVSVVCSNALNRAVKEFKITEPGKILDKTRELVLETFEKSEGDIKDGMDVSLCSIEKTAAGANLKWSGANNPLWYVNNNELHEVKPDKQPIGKHDNAVPFTTHSVNVPLGSTLYLFTDGYADQFGGEKSKKLTTKQFKEILAQIAKEPMQKQLELLDEKLKAWQGKEEQIDDILVMGIRV